MNRLQPRRRDIILRLPWRVRRELTAAEKREFEEEIDALSSHSSDPEGPEDPGDTQGKSIEEITAWCIQYERKQKMERIARQQAGIEGMHAIKLH